ncbi:DUF6115 domain-containing protein [Butyrivibrio fibrisolvens]|uniref:Uncharacterized protein n=1 Tax=Butyrivibrio fibrisolvens TaxID=831 RepID=A0A317G239_BUTFI|nr:DUF6115 domain-containing protein [Butyrivibrio fibrisolvens]PWT28114.1 hypothetical protein CPT75_13840 [Butyrivibrio fibrisolvens]
MGIGVIILLVGGVAAIVLGFILPIGKELEKDDQKSMESAVAQAVHKTIEKSHDKIQQQIDDTIEESLIKTERGLDRITNEKMSAISEYADTVMNDIHKNHDEVMFMYDMLNDKQKNLTSTVDEAAKAQEKVNQTVLDAEITARQAREAATKVSMMAHGINPGSANIAPPDSNSAAGFYDAATPPVSFHNAAASNFFENLGIDGYELDGTVSGIQQARAATDRNNKKPGSSVFGDVRAGKSSPGADQNIFDGIDAKSSGFAPLGATQHLSSEDLDQQFARVFGSTDNNEEDYSALTDEMEAVRAIAAATTDPVSDKVIPIADAQRSVREDDDAGEQARQNNKIMEMHEAGKSNIAIARELGLGVGEVGLVIELAQKNKRKRQI